MMEEWCLIRFMFYYEKKNNFSNFKNYHSQIFHHFAKWIFDLHHILSWISNFLICSTFKSFEFMLTPTAILFSSCRTYKPIRINCVEHICHPKNYWNAKSLLINFFFYVSSNFYLNNWKKYVGTIEMPKEDHGVLIISALAIASFLTCLLCILCQRKRKRRHHRQLHRNAHYDSTTSATGNYYNTLK